MKEYYINTSELKSYCKKLCVGDKVYYNHSNGIRISSAGVHKISVPEEVLDKEGKYTIPNDDRIITWNKIIKAGKKYRKKHKIILT